MALSLMMRHYLETKEKYKDCILFYRLGDFSTMPKRFLNFSI